MNKFLVWLIASTIGISSIIIWWHGHTKQEKSTKLHVVCTTTFLHDALQIIGQGDICLVSLMHPGIDPHLYKPTEQDMHTLADADLIIYHGLHLEGKMGELFKQMNHYVPTAAACDGLSNEQLRSTDIANVYDPHVWFSIPLWIEVINHLARTLAHHDPEYKDIFMQRAATYTNQLANLHQELNLLIHKIPAEQRILITAHDAFGYFGKTYGFEVLGLQGISTDADTSIAEVQHLAQYIIQHSIPMLFTEHTIPEKNIRVLQEIVASYHQQVAIGPELYTDSLSDQTSPASTYESLMRYTVETIVNGLMNKE